MNFPVSSSLKGMLLKGSPLFCGTMGVSLGGWYTNENANSVHNKLLSDGYQYKVTKPNLSSKSVARSNEKEGKPDFFTFKKDKCFTTLFPKVEEIKWEKNTSETSEEESLSISEAQIKDDKSVGCLLMEFSETTNKQLPVIKTELAFKNENQGFVLWTGFVDKEKNDTSQTSGYAAHYLFYLEKSRDKWNIKIGYFVMENNTNNFSIKVPNSNKRWPSTHYETINYAGVWKSTSWSNKEILEDIYENLNGKFTNTGVVSDVYNISSNKWLTAGSSSEDGSLDISKTLDPIINISKNKKGQWIKLDSYCWGLSRSDLHLKDLCYEKSE